MIDLGRLYIYNLRIYNWCHHCSEGCYVYANFNLMLSFNRFIFTASVEANDPDFQKLKNLFDQLEENFTNGIAADVFPVLKYLPSKVYYFSAI